METRDPITIHQLYPNLTPEEIKQAEINIQRYLNAVIRICERLQAEGLTAEDLDLTEARHGAIVQTERSNPSTPNN